MFSRGEMLHYHCTINFVFAIIIVAAASAILAIVAVIVIATKIDIANIAAGIGTVINAMSLVLSLPSLINW